MYYNEIFLEGLWKSMNTSSRPRSESESSRIRSSCDDRMIRKHKSVRTKKTATCLRTLQPSIYAMWEVQWRTSRGYFNEDFSYFRYVCRFCPFYKKKITLPFCCKKTLASKVRTATTRLFLFCTSKQLVLWKLFPITKWYFTNCYGSQCSLDAISNHLHYPRSLRMRMCWMCQTAYTFVLHMHLVEGSH